MAAADHIDLQENESRLPWRYAAAGVSILLFVGLVALSYRLGMRDIANNAVPFVRADGEPVKVRPVEPGGAVFTNSDLGTVYERRHTGVQSNEVLAPEAEHPPVPAAVVSAAPAVPAVSVPTVAPSNAPAVASAPVTPAVVPVTPAPAVVAEPAVKPAPKVQPVTPHADLRSVEKIIAGLDGHATPVHTAPVHARAARSFVQLASVRTRADAEQLVSDYKSRFGELLETDPTIVRAEIDGRGVYYRVRVAYADAAKAKQVCGVMRTHGVSCIPLNE